MIAVFCQNDRCPAVLATGRPRFIGERDNERAGWSGFCGKCRIKTVIVPAREMLQTAT